MRSQQTPAAHDHADGRQVHQIDQTILRLLLDADLRLEHARWLRGAVAGTTRRPEFHNHTKHGFLYHHPLIRYDVCTGAALICGISSGSLLLRELPELKALRLGPNHYSVLEQSVEQKRVVVGPTAAPASYAFRSPYLALNQENHAAWEYAPGEDRRHLLERVVIGNLLSLSKAIDLHVEERLRVEVDLEPDGWHEIKPGLRMLGFRGSFHVNFLIPELWGVGKSSARGFGTVTRLET